MNWKSIKLPRPQLGRLRWQQLSPAAWKKLLCVGLGAAALVGGFCGGRYGFNEARAQERSNSPLANLAIHPNGPGSDYSRRVVAYIFGNRPITREELGEYLIERVGAERLEFLVNRRIIEM